MVMETITSQFTGTARPNGRSLEMRNQDRAEVIRGKARVLSYDELMEVALRAAELDDGTTECSSDGYAWHPDGYPTPQDRVNHVGSALGRILFAKGGCAAAAFDAFLPALNEALGRKSSHLAAVAAA